MADDVHEVVGRRLRGGERRLAGRRPRRRQVRKALGVTAFGVNAIEIPPGYETGRHYYEQEELYFVHRGRVEMTFDDGESHVLGPGGVARVDAATIRKVKNVGDEPAVYLVTGGKDGYVGRDGQAPRGRDQPLRRGGSPRLSGACAASRSSRRRSRSSPCSSPPSRRRGGRCRRRRAARSSRPTTTGTCALTAFPVRELRRDREARSARARPCRADFGSGLYERAPIGIPFRTVRRSQPSVP